MLHRLLYFVLTWLVYISEMETEELYVSKSSSALPLFPHGQQISDTHIKSRKEKCLQQ